MTRLTRGIYALNDKSYTGYGDTTRWNGWYCPAFDKATAVKLLKDIADKECGSFKWRYSAKNDTFILAHGADGWEKMKIKGDTYDTDQGELHLYDIGSHCWCWEKIKDTLRDELMEKIEGVRLGEARIQELLNLLPQSGKECACRDKEYYPTYTEGEYGIELSKTCINCGGYIGE